MLLNCTLQSVVNALNIVFCAYTALIVLLSVCTSTYASAANYSAQAQSAVSATARSHTL
jgi:hypothetical protein